MTVRKTKKMHVLECRLVVWFMGIVIENSLNRQSSYTFVELRQKTADILFAKEMSKEIKYSKVTIIFKKWLTVKLKIIWLKIKLKQNYKTYNKKVQKNKILPKVHSNACSIALKHLLVLRKQFWVAKCEQIQL